MDVRPTNDKEGREELREKGQFFTPQWITTAMSAFILRGNPTQIFEPGFGTGAFFVGATSAAESMGVDLPVYRGCETDESALTRAIDQGVPEDIIQNISWKSFFDYPDDGVHPAIIGNPPYIRHHRLSRTEKRKLSRLATDITGKKIDKSWLPRLRDQIIGYSSRVQTFVYLARRRCRRKFRNRCGLNSNITKSMAVTFSPMRHHFPVWIPMRLSSISSKKNRRMVQMVANKTDSSLFKRSVLKHQQKSTEAIEFHPNLKSNVQAPQGR